MSAPSAEKIAELIQQYGFMPLQIKEISPPKKILTRAIFTESVTTKEIIILTRQLATLLGAGVSVLNSLDTVQEQITNPNMNAMLASIRKDIEGGKKLSDGLKAFPRCFSPVYVNMVMAGEAGGILVDILNRLSALIEYEEAVKQKIKKALRYPAMVLAALGIASIVLTVFVLPNFSGLFSLLGGKVPLPTRIVMGVSYFMIHYGWLLLIAIVAGAMWLKKYIQTEKGRYQWDKQMISLPILGKLIKKIIISRFCRVFGMLLQSGLPILRAIDIVAETTNNKLIAGALDVVKGKVQSGQGLAVPLRESGLFPLTVIHMVGVGEKSGNMSEMLFKVADYFDGEIVVDLDNLASLIEPILIGFLAIIVLFVALSIFLPLWSMMDMVK